MKIDSSKLGIILSVFFGVVGLVFGAYQYYKSPEPVVNMLNNEQLFSLKENMPELQVLYNGKDLRKKNKDITILRFKVLNEGRESMTKNTYDELAPLGVEIVDGELLKKPEIVGLSDSSYVGKIIAKTTASKIYFNSVTLDPNQFFELKCYVKNDFGKRPQIKILGKIAGIESIETIDNTKQIELELEKTRMRIIVQFAFVLLLLCIFMLVIRYRNTLKHNEILIMERELGDQHIVEVMARMKQMKQQEEKYLELLKDKT